MIDKKVVVKKCIFLAGVCLLITLMSGCAGKPAVVAGDEAPRNMTVADEDMSKPLILYGVDTDNDRVYAINTSSGKVIANITVGDEPTGLAATPDGKKLYVANAMQDSAIRDNSGVVTAIDTSTNRIVSTIFTGRNSCRVAVSPDGKFAYVTNMYEQSISVINTADDSVALTFPLKDEKEEGPYAIVVSPDGKKLYVTLPFGQSVKEIDAATGRVLSTIKVGEEAYQLAISPDGKLLYVQGLLAIEPADGNQMRYGVEVIDTKKRKIVSEVALSAKLPHGLVASPDGRKVYAGTEAVAVIDAVSDDVIGEVDVGQGMNASLGGGKREPGNVSKNIYVPKAIALSRNGKMMFASYVEISPDQKQSCIIYRINTENYTVVSEMKPGTVLGPMVAVRI